MAGQTEPVATQRGGRGPWGALSRGGSSVREARLCGWASKVGQSSGAEGQAAGRSRGGGVCGCLQGRTKTLRVR